MTAWQPIETAPTEQRVLLFTDTTRLPASDPVHVRLTKLGLHHANVQVGRFYRNRWQQKYVGEPLHWMPLPDPPEQST